MESLDPELPQHDAVTQGVWQMDRCAAVPGTLGPRLRTVRLAALIACIVAVLSEAVPMWDYTHRMFAMEATIGSFGVILSILVGYVVTAIFPLFYFALYRNEADLPASRGMRRMAITAAAVIAIVKIADIAQWIASFRRESALQPDAVPWTIGGVSAAPI